VSTKQRQADKGRGVHHYPYPSLSARTYARLGAKFQGLRGFLN